MRFKADLPLLERAAPAHGLPRVEIDWTPEELANLDKLASDGPREPTQELVDLMAGH